MSFRQMKKILLSEFTENDESWKLTAVPPQQSALQRILRHFDFPRVHRRRLATLRRLWKLHADRALGERLAHCAPRAPRPAA